MSATQEPTPEIVNPYRAPEPTPGEQEWVLPTDPTALRRERKYAAIGRVMVTWEKLRVAYNAVLVLTVLAIVAVVITMEPGEVAIFRVAIFGAVMANICFCAGPIVDGYLTWLGIRSPIITGILFVAGTLLAMLLTLMSFVGRADPGF